MTSRLFEIARGGATASAPVADEHCDLCAAPLPPEHRHVLDLDSGQPQCACRACVILFDRGQAGGGHYRLIPQRRVRLGDFALDERLWASLGVPVDLAFVFVSTPADAAVACYPSPLGVTRHIPAPDAWEEIVAANPLLHEMEPDVEALLVHRARGAREHWLVPIDDCYRLVARLRVHWSGLSGGDRVWEEIAGFFGELNREEDA